MSIPFLHSPADIIRYALVYQGIGSLPPAEPWPIYADVQLGSLLENISPDNVLSTFDTAHITSGKNQVTRERLRHFGVQLMVRSTDPSDGYARIEMATNYLEEQVLETQVVIDEATYVIHSVACRGIIFIGHEKQPKSDRVLFTQNVVTPIRRVA